MSQASQLTWKKAIHKVLDEASTPLHYQEIAERIITEGYRTEVGATPAATVNALISSSIKKEKNRSPYIRISKGIFTLKNKAPHDTAQDDDDTPLSETEVQYDIITSFGMFWRRDHIEWSPTPQLLGMQQLGTTPVDFYSQLGIYLLYDGREIIYVGRSTDRPLGKRLYEHTRDRLATRWDRFSWFGLLPVSDNGKIGDLPTTYSAEKLIPALEAILIEALEPRQNRKRGDDLSAVEYLQKVDPLIEKSKIQEVFSTVINKL